jgi:hypothetical protein
MGVYKEHKQYRFIGTFVLPTLYSNISLQSSNGHAFGILQPLHYEQSEWLTMRGND